MTDNWQIERVSPTACVTGENPLWHPDEKAVYWTDIPGARIYRFDPATDETTVAYSGDIVGGFTLQADGSLLLFGAGGKISQLRHGEVAVALRSIPAEQNTRFNDVIADPAGRVFCGTMPTKERSGRLYRLGHDLTLAEVVSGVGISNGLGFSPDHKTLYYTDSDPAREIYEFDYSEDTGEIGNRRVFAKVSEGNAVPDGLTVDAEGRIWSARWDGGCVVRYSPDGREVGRLHVPGAVKVSNITFGGEGYLDMYITTAGGDDRGANGTDAGALFRARTGVRGVPEFRSRIAVR
jgi:D-xylono/L-arabinono-1,4-lactonase